MWKDIIGSSLFTVLFPVLLVLSVIIGGFIAKKTWINKKIVWKGSGIESSVIAIFSLLLSFTFFASNNLMPDRIAILNNVKEAASGLGRVSMFTNDTVRQQTRIYLIGNLSILSDFNSQYLVSEEKLRENMEGIDEKYLDILAPIAKRDSSVKSDVFTLLTYINRLNGSFYRLVNSYDERTPPITIILLVLSALLIGVLIGFLNSFNSKTHFLVPVIFVVIVSLSIQSIRDLDNPYQGSIEPNFKDFSNQLKLIQHSPLKSF